MLEEIKKAVMKTVSRKKAEQLVEAAKSSIGVDYGEYSTDGKTGINNKSNGSIGSRNGRSIEKMEVQEYLLGITRMGVVSIVMCLGGMVNLLRFVDVRHMSHYL